MYSSVARTCIFARKVNYLFPKYHWKKMYRYCKSYASISRVIYLSFCLMYSYKTSMIIDNNLTEIWKIHSSVAFLFLIFTNGAILAKTLIFVLALLHIWLIWFSKLNFQPISIPDTLRDCCFNLWCTYIYINKWHLLAFPFNSFSVNHWNRFDYTFYKPFNFKHSLQYHSPL